MHHFRGCYRGFLVFLFLQQVFHPCCQPSRRWQQVLNENEGDVAKCHPDKEPLPSKQDGRRVLQEVRGQDVRGVGPKRGGDELRRSMRQQVHGGAGEGAPLVY